MSAEFVVILFFSSSHAIRAETVLARIGIVGNLMPVPRHLSSDCGVCLRLPGNWQEEALAALRDGKVEIEACHDI